MRASTSRPRGRSCRTIRQLAETSRGLQKELLTRASVAAAPATRPRPNAGSRTPMAPVRRARNMASIRRMLQDPLIGARAGKMSTLDAILQCGAGERPPVAASRWQRQVLPARTASRPTRPIPAVATARSGLGKAYLTRAARRAGARRHRRRRCLAARSAHHCLCQRRPEHGGSRADDRAREGRAERSRVVGANTLPRIAVRSRPSFRRRRAIATSTAGWSWNSRCAPMAPPATSS